MSGVDWELYKYWLGSNKRSERESVIETAQSSIFDNLENNPAYQAESKRNGQEQPFLASRTEANKCKISLLPGDEMYIGDLLEIFGEHWICKELYTDELGLTYGEAWMCNQIFFFQNRTSKIIRRYAILDDGSYAAGEDKAIKVVNGKFTCYMSLDEETRGIYVDKRLAIDIIINKEGKEILETGKVTGIDLKSGNYGKGSHLLTFYLTDDVYNAEADSVEHRICDMIGGEYAASERETKNDTLVIDGRGNLRLGTGRTYSAYISGAQGNKEVTVPLIWKADAGYVILLPSGNQCMVRIPLDEKLIGNRFTLICETPSNRYQTAEKTVEVVSIG